jgi:hypothetical protein
LWKKSDELAPFTVFYSSIDNLEKMAAWYGNVCFSNGSSLMGQFNFVRFFPVSLSVIKEQCHGNFTLGFFPSTNALLEL